MNFRRTSRRGFSLVELLAVVLVIAVLAAVAVPLYTSQRKSAAGRTCKANLAAIMASASAYALRNNVYPATIAAMKGTAEGLAEEPKCPLTADAYTWTVNGDGSASLTCPNDASHAGYGGAAGDWTKTLAKPATDSLP